MQQTAAEINASSKPATPVDEQGYPLPVTGQWRPEAKNDACCGDGCCIALWCPCISFGQISARIGALSYGTAALLYLLLVVAPNLAARYYVYDWYFTKSCYSFYEVRRACYDAEEDDEDTMGKLFASLQLIIILGACSTGLAFALLLWLRMRVRSIFQVPGNCTEDVLCSLFCQCCSLVQLGLQVGSRRLPDSGASASSSCGPPPKYTATTSLTVNDNDVFLVATPVIGGGTPVMAGVVGNPESNGVVYMKV